MLIPMFAMVLIMSVLILVLFFIGTLFATFARMISVAELWAAESQRRACVLGVRCIFKRVLRTTLWCIHQSGLGFLLRSRPSRASMSPRHAFMHRLFAKNVLACSAPISGELVRMLWLPNA